MYLETTTCITNHIHYIIANFQILKVEYEKHEFYGNSKRCSTQMFVRMLAVHCDQNNSYEITMNCYQAR